ncbi:MAG TPA: hypothetical protein VLV15_08360, partial [Dongiaceae bacterium]|nr:hypothetical protein [Dongiaceae bacterium]
MASWVLFLVVLTLLVLAISGAHAALRHEPAGAGPALRLVSPLEGERVAEPAARLEAVVPAGMRDARLVMSRQRFDPSSWTTLPEGSGWIVVPYGPGPLAIGTLGLGIRNDTVWWWAIVTRDPRTGAFAVSEVRSFTLIPRFANRVAPAFQIEPSARGVLPADPAPATRAGRATGRPIDLTAGYTIVPGGPPPALPADLVRAGGERPQMPTERGAYLVQFGDDSPDSARVRIT